jgi:hypothetical protein
MNAPHWLHEMAELPVPELAVLAKSDTMAMVLLSRAMISQYPQYREYYDAGILGTALEVSGCDIDVAVARLDSLKGEASNIYKGSESSPYSTKIRQLLHECFPSASSRDIELAQLKGEFYICYAALKLAQEVEERENDPRVPGVSK